MIQSVVVLTGGLSLSFFSVLLVSACNVAAMASERPAYVFSLLLRPPVPQAPQNWSAVIHHLEPHLSDRTLHHVCTHHYHRCHRRSLQKDRRFQSQPAAIQPHPDADAERKTGQWGLREPYTG